MIFDCFDQNWILILLQSRTSKANSLSLRKRNGVCKKIYVDGNGKLNIP